ncbi:hypothetical protein [Paracoccus luteus]|uniref:hypothetical protein n=1 Tax=Paracoccus luteus TaxID=2508543 RepID=UPI00106F9F74|nr:hypothetical protein [Paracoccus luteus]
MARALTLWMAAGALALAGCVRDEGGPARPPSKPEQVSVKVMDRSAAGTRLSRARVSTKSGDILILEPDGSVTEVALDSAAGREAFSVTEAELAELSVNLGLDLSAADVGNFELVSPGKPRLPTAQQKALEAFAARTRPALPDFPKDFTADPALFVGARVDAIKGDRKGDLVEVTANLKPGVDADVAFAYATCALAGWAKGTGRHYARHIRTLQDKRNGKLLVGSVFTLSDTQPMGLRVMETNDTLRACKARGIPAA